MKRSGVDATTHLNPSRTLTALPAPHFALALTLNCGQVFHWQARGAGWLGMIGDRPCYVEQRGGELLVTRGMEQETNRYFALDHPLEKILASFPRDAAMEAAAAA